MLGYDFQGRITETQVKAHNLLFFLEEGNIEFH